MNLLLAFHLWQVAPLKAFPLNDETIDFANGNYSSNKSYAQASSYQEKYLKKLGISTDSAQSQVSSRSQGQANSKNLESNSHIGAKSSENTSANDSNDNFRRQSEKYFSLDNLYNIDDNINSENNVQKRKLANLNSKSKAFFLTFYFWRT